MKQAVVTDSDKDNKTDSEEDESDESVCESEIAIPTAQSELKAKIAELDVLKQYNMELEAENFDLKHEVVNLRKCNKEHENRIKELKKSRRGTDTENIFIQLVKQFEREMANKLRRTLQKEGKYSSFQSYRENTIPRQVSIDTNYYDLRCIESSLEFRLSTFKKDDSTEANKLFIQESGTLSKEILGNTNRYGFVSGSGEPHILGSSVEAKREGCKIHNGFIDLLPNITERSGSKVKEGELAGNTLNKEEGQCPNIRKMEKMQTSLGKLRRVGSLGGDDWKMIVPQKMCHLIYPNFCCTEDELSSIANYSNMIQMRSSERVNKKTSYCNDLILVDIFEDKSRIATLINNYEVLNNDGIDPKELIYYIKIVAEFGFDHIIIIGEIEFGLLFLDCYGRVFLWEDQGQMLWPLGNSPEDVSKCEIKGVDQVRWFVVNGIVYKYITKWEDTF
ncbi:hypothetical protein GLOIN_2v1785628 [Rhizophagus irregularis DAOM 181602=DAOM 197198]|nr:hypothetical protein GLOIN_2v1785628 [Rhizophagus irregularis DAOM 181602=DAOM 197198]